MTVSDLLEQPCNKSDNAIKLVTSFFTDFGTDISCHQLTCYVQTISNLLEQLVASLLASSTLLQDDNILFQTCRNNNLFGEVRNCHSLITFLVIFTTLFNISINLYNII
jgi:hypothetical protein